MDLQINRDISKAYRNNAQKIRVSTENWVRQNVYCPRCGNNLVQFPNNQPAADFFCPICKEEYELKSKAGKIGGTVADGAYKTMIERIQAINNPNFFFLSYRKADFKVQNLFAIPKYFFTVDIIKKRKPLAQTARRAGWTGCNISIDMVPVMGRIYLIQNEIPVPSKEVIQNFLRTSFIAEYRMDARGWLLDVMCCIEKTPGKIFTLAELYAFSETLQIKYPRNQHIKAKIRQQLQILRNRGLIEFLGNGRYRKCFDNKCNK